MVADESYHPFPLLDIKLSSKMCIDPPHNQFEFRPFFCDFENGGYVPSTVIKSKSIQYLNLSLWQYVGKWWF